LQYYSHAQGYDKCAQFVKRRASSVVTVSCCGCELWTAYEGRENKLQAMEMDCLRSAKIEEGNDTK